jgi:hypothetical protein
MPAHSVPRPPVTHAAYRHSINTPPIVGPRPCNVQPGLVCYDCHPGPSPDRGFHLLTREVVVPPPSAIKAPDLLVARVICASMVIITSLSMLMHELLHW